MFERLLCAIFGHRYVVERELNERARKVGCTRCAGQWAMHDPTRSFVPWNGEFEALYAPGGFLAEPMSGRRVSATATPQKEPNSKSMRKTSEQVR